MNLAKCLAARQSNIAINPAAEDYPFENIVFEGGGIKTISYIGVIKVSTSHSRCWKIGSSYGNSI